MDLMHRTGRELRAVLRAETPTHRRYRDHLTVIVVATIGVDLVCSVLAYFLERHAAGTEIHTIGSAFFWASTQLLTVSSQMKDPISFGGRTHRARDGPVRMSRSGTAERTRDLRTLSTEH